MNDHLNQGLDGVTTLDLLTVPEAAKLLRISRNLAYELVARKEIPAIRLGRVIRVPREGLEAWLDQQVNGHRQPVHRRPGWPAAYDASRYRGRSNSIARDPEPPPPSKPGLA